VVLHGVARRRRGLPPQGVDQHLDRDHPTAVACHRCGRRAGRGRRTPRTGGPEPACVQPYLSILDWHPTEATALVAAAALGIRGTVEIRDAAIAVRLSDTSGGVYAQDGRVAAAASPLTTALAASASLTNAEEAVRRICGISEIDYERTKAKILRTPTRPTSHEELGHRADSHHDQGSFAYRRLNGALELATAVPGAGALVRYQDRSHPHVMRHVRMTGSVELSFS
jgi:hypothetical protein